MFYCNECRDKMKWPESFSQSKGPCEMCGKISICNDVHHSHLPAYKENKEKE